MNAIVLMMSDSHGMYIPFNFINDVDRVAWHVSDADADSINRGLEYEDYWDAWDSILNSAYYEDNGHKYTLHHDGDLWAICPELMTNEEYSNFFGDITWN